MFYKWPILQMTGNNIYIPLILCNIFFQNDEHLTKYNKKHFSDCMPHIHIVISIIITALCVAVDEHQRLQNYNINTRDILILCTPYTVNT